MNFSIVLASRERSQLLVGLLASLEETTTDKDKIEVLIGIDDDDPESQDARVHLTKKHSFAKFFSRTRSNMLNRDYINWVYDNNGSGKYVIVCNDDAAFRTVGWDTIILENLNNYLSDKPDGVVYGFISDALSNRHGMAYCCFPLVSRKGVRAVGFCMPPEYPGWNADIALWRLYSSVGRVCDLSSVMIEHISYHCGKRERDPISHHVQHISNQYAHIPQHVFNEYINRLRSAINANS